MPDRLQNLLQLWKYQPPWFFDEFDRLEEVFPAASYQYVLYGMGYKTQIDPLRDCPSRKVADRLMSENAALTQRLRKQLPPNRDLISKIREHGLQPI